MFNSIKSNTTSFTAAQLNGFFHQLAANLQLNTKRAIGLAIREAGLPGRNAFIEDVLEKRKTHNHQRDNRQERRNLKRTGKTNPSRAAKHSKQPVLLPTGTPATRLAELRREKAQAVAFKVFRHGAAGGTSFQVEVTENPGEIDYYVEIDTNRDTYRGRFQGWKANEDHHVVTLPLQWMTRILNRNLAVLDGLMTLEAREIASGASDVELFKAVWARQGRGYTVTTERGYIAKHGDTSYHAATAEKALSGLQRKLKQLGQPARQVRSALKIDDAAFIKRYRRYDDCMLSLSDARASGSCEPGILSWCERVGIDPNRQAVPMTEALEAFSRLPLKEVRLAVLHAVRRHRQELRNAH